MSKPDLYEALNVERSASKDEIRRAFRRAAKETHPDAGGDRERFELVVLASKVLGDDQRRARYDQTGEFDAGADDKPAMARSKGFAELSAVFAELDAKGASETTDVIAIAVRRIREEMASIRNDQAGAREQVARIRRIAKRFKAKRGRKNLFAEMVDRQADNIAAQIAEAGRRLEICALAIEQLNDHTYAFDRLDPVDEALKQQLRASGWRV